MLCIHRHLCIHCALDSAHPQTSAFATVPHITKRQQLASCSCATNPTASFTKQTHPRCAHRPSCTHSAVPHGAAVGSAHTGHRSLRKWWYLSNVSIGVQGVPIAPLAIRQSLSGCELCVCGTLCAWGAASVLILSATRQHRTRCAGYVCRHSCARLAWSQVCLPSVQAARSLIRLAGRHGCRREGSRGACRKGAGGWGGEATVSAVRHRSDRERSCPCGAVCIGHAVLTTVLTV